MKFELESAKYYENSEIIKAYPQLKEFGYYEKVNYYDSGYYCFISNFQSI